MDKYVFVHKRQKKPLGSGTVHKNTNIYKDAYAKSHPLMISNGNKTRVWS